MEKKSAMLKKSNGYPTMVCGKRVYGFIESTDSGCEANHSMRKKSRVYEEIVEVGHKNTTRTVDLRSRISPSKILTDSKKVLLTTTLKTKFTETILKAQQKVTIINENDKIQKERLKKKKADAKADIRTAQLVLKKQRWKEREIARLAIQNIKKTMVWNDAIEVEQEFEKLIGYRIVESTDDDCVPDYLMGTKSSISEKIVEMGDKNKIETVGLPTRINSLSKFPTDWNKVLRAAMLKTRFAETILKAQQKVIVVNENDKAEKKRLEKKKADTEADIRAAKMLLQNQWQIEREIARLAPENLKKTVVWNDTLQVDRSWRS